MKLNLVFLFLVKSNKLLKEKINIDHRHNFKSKVIKKRKFNKIIIFWIKNNKDHRHNFLNKIKNNSNISDKHKNKPKNSVNTESICTYKSVGLLKLNPKILLLV